MTRLLALAGSGVLALTLLYPPRPFSASSPAPADLDLTRYRELLSRVVRGSEVDYRAILSDRAALDRVVADFGLVPGPIEQRWTRHQRMAFWNNAYNQFTLRAIVDHYPIRGWRLSLGPRNSIRRIDGVWTRLKWRAAARDVTLDQIEHAILRPEFGDARVHLALNCASRGCPPLRADPYVGADLDRQLDDAARQYLATPAGSRVLDGRLLVSKIFDWYGGDFVKQYAGLHPGPGDAADRAIRGFVQQYGPPAAAAAARAGSAIQFLDYDWSLNDAA